VATNIEIKARVRDADSFRQRARALSGTSGELILQEDTFFRTPQGRLKLRELASGSGQLIYYERPDVSSARRSDYLIAATEHPAELKAVLAAGLGVRGIVRKQRWLYMVGQTRVHLDHVEGLGWFMELEVVLRPGQSDAEGIAIAVDLIQKLGIEQADLVQGAYIDLLET